MRRGPGGHGYGCACLRVVVDPENQDVLEILSGKAKPLSVCRRDPAIKKIELQLK